MYRGKYLIGIYAPITEGETLLALVSNIKEFAELMGIHYATAAMTLHYLYNKKLNRVRFCGRLCAIALIDATEEDE